MIVACVLTAATFSSSHERPPSMPTAVMYGGEGERWNKETALIRYEPPRDVSKRRICARNVPKIAFGAGDNTSAASAALGTPGLPPFLTRGRPKPWNRIPIDPVTNPPHAHISAPYAWLVCGLHHSQCTMRTDLPYMTTGMADLNRDQVCMYSGATGPVIIQAEIGHDKLDLEIANLEDTMAADLDNCKHAGFLHPSPKTCTVATGTADKAVGVPFDPCFQKAYMYGDVTTGLSNDCPVALSVLPTIVAMSTIRYQRPQRCVLVTGRRHQYVCAFCGVYGRRTDSLSDGCSTDQIVSQQKLLAMLHCHVQCLKPVGCHRGRALSSTRASEAAGALVRPFERKAPRSEGATLWGTCRAHSCTVWNRVLTVNTATYLRHEHKSMVITIPASSSQMSCDGSGRQVPLLWQRCCVHMSVHVKSNWRMTSERRRVPGRVSRILHRLTFGRSIIYEQRKFREVKEFLQSNVLFPTELNWAIESKNIRASRSPTCNGGEMCAISPSLVCTDCGLSTPLRLTNKGLTIISNVGMMKGEGCAPPASGRQNVLNAPACHVPDTRYHEFYGQLVFQVAAAAATVLAFTAAQNNSGSNTERRSCGRCVWWLPVLLWASLVLLPFAGALNPSGANATVQRLHTSGGSVHALSTSAIPHGVQPLARNIDVEGAGSNAVIVKTLDHHHRALQSCGLGKYFAANATPACVACAAGRYGNASGSTACQSCKPCPPGNYPENRTGANSSSSCKCLACAVGKYMRGGSGQSASSWDADNAADVDKSDCIACPAGKYTAGAAGRTNASDCVDWPRSSYEILRTDCNGQIVFMEKSAWEIRAEFHPIKQIFEHLKTWIATRARATCGDDWSDDQIDDLYNPVLGVVTMIESLSTNVTHTPPKCRDKFGDLNFATIFDIIKADLDYDKLVLEIAKLEDKHQNAADMDNCTHAGFLHALPKTCSVATIKAGKGCAFQIPLTEVVGTEGFSLAIALSVCPTTMLPFMSFRINGPGAAKTLAPCTSNDHCGHGQQCIDILGAGDYTIDVDGLEDLLDDDLSDEKEIGVEIGKSLWSDVAKDFAAAIFRCARSYAQVRTRTRMPHALTARCRRAAVTCLGLRWTAGRSARCVC